MAEPPTNVTPFRPRKPPEAERKSGFDMQRPQHKVVLVYALGAIAFAIYFVTSMPIELIGLGFGVACVAIAASNRDDGMPWARTHHEFALRTMLIGAAVWMIAGLLTWVPLLGAVASLAQIATLIWVGVRFGVGLLRAAQRKPVPNPMTFLV